MIAGAAVLTPVAQRLRHILSAALSLIGVVFLYWVGLAADSSLDSTFVAGSVWHMGAVQLGGGILLVVGVASSIVHPDRVIGLLLAGLGVTWLAPEVAGWVGGPQWIRSASLPLGVLFVPLLLHLGLVYPIGKTENSLDRRLVKLAYGATASLVLAITFLYDPFLDLHCWRTCSSSPFVIVGDPGLSRWMIRASVWTAAGSSVVLLWRASARSFAKWSRRGVVPGWFLGPLVVLGVAEVTYSILVLVRLRVDPSDALMAGFVFAGGALLAAMGLGIAWDLLRDIRRRRSLAELVSDLEAASGPLVSVLANSLSDPSVMVAYWIPSLQRHVDSRGRSLVPSTGPGRAVATLERSGVELGKVIHGSHLSADDLEHEIGAAARLAVDNERLRAELLAQALEIRASQERIVAGGDAARRRLERDLHDGAQQSLLALSYKLRIAEAAAHRAGADTLERALSEANGEALTTIDEVRRLAHGIFPSILVDAGLVRALETLREESRVQMEIDLPDRDCGGTTAMAVYQLVAAVGDLSWSDGARVSISGQDVDDRLVVDITVDTTVDVTVAASALVHAVDRIGAVGGMIAFTETGMHLELPCG